MVRQLEIEHSNGRQQVQAHSIVVIDDDRRVRRFVASTLEGDGLQVLVAATTDEGLELIQQQHPAVALLDLPDAERLEWFHKLRRISPGLPIIFLAETNDSDTAIEAMKLGAEDVLLKPVVSDELRRSVRMALESRLPAAELPRPATADNSAAASAFLGQSPEMQEVFKAIGRVASQDATVLIRGETGTGKELVAQAICKHSQRHSEIFMAVNCAAIPESLLESELFGHEKGAFTGANERRIGRFEQCSRGTLFLDEIGDMSPLAQTKVLRVLQSQEFERVGGNETIKTNARLLAATNRDLEQLVAEGKFRSDLYYRLQGFCVNLPPLRERGDDVQILVANFIQLYNRELGREIQGVAPAAMELLTKYSWPGNVRELQCMLRQAMLACTGPIIQVASLPEAVRCAAERSRADHEVGSGGIVSFIRQRLRQGSHDLYAESLELLERHLITSVLRETNGNQLQAARILGISRASLRNKIRTLGLSIRRNITSSSHRPQRVAH